MEHTVSDLDPVTQTNYLQITSEHVHFDWTIDFDAKVISGSATHTLVAHEDDVSEVMYVAIVYFVIPCYGSVKSIYCIVSTHLLWILRKSKSKGSKLKSVFPSFTRGQGT